MISYCIAGFGPNGRGHVLENSIHPRLRKQLKFIAGFDPDPACKASTKCVGWRERLKRAWVAAIGAGRQPALSARISANMCVAGICAVEAARSGRPVQVPSFT